MILTEQLNFDVLKLSAGDKKLCAVPAMVNLMNSVESPVNRESVTFTSLWQLKVLIIEANKKR